MNKRILGLLLTGLIVGNMCSVTTFASQIDESNKKEVILNEEDSSELSEDDKKNAIKIEVDYIDKAFKDELFKNKSFSAEILRNETFEEKNIYKITITDENRDEVYEKLALTEYMKQMKQELDKDKKIVKQVIYIAPTRQQKVFNESTKMMKSEERLPDYESVPMKAVFVKTQIVGDSVDLWDKKDLTESLVESTLSKSLGIALGFATPWLWVPDAILGLSSSWFDSNCSYGKVLRADTNENRTTKFIYVKDVDNLYSNYDWYPCSSTQMTNMLVNITFHYVDKNGNPQSKRGQTRKKFHADYYEDKDGNTEYLQKRAYKTYKGLPGGIEFHDDLPPWDWYLNH